MRRGQAVALLAVTVAAVLAGGGTARAQAFSRITRYDVDVAIRGDGGLRVRETIDYDFGTTPHHGIFRTVPVRFRYDGRYDRVYPLHDIRVTASPGTPAQTKVTTEGGTTVIKIGDPDREITGAHSYVIDYEVDAAINRFADHDELYWNVIGTEWDVPIGAARVVVHADTPATQIACFAGPSGSNLPCDDAKLDGGRAVFGQRALGPYSGMTVVVALPPGAVDVAAPILRERWSADRAFARTPATVGMAGVLLLAGFGGVGWLGWRTGRDRRFAGEVPGLLPPEGVTAVESPRPLFTDPAGPIEYAPSADLRPALMGVLIDESADALDVTATIVDLAVRRHLTIEELPKKHFFSKTDWRLTRLDAPGDALATWEQLLVDALFDDGPTVEMSSLKNSFYTDLQKIQQELYAEVMRQGWFRSRPDTTRGKWFALGILVLVAGIGLTVGAAYATRLGLVPVPLILIGVLLLAVHRRMPSRTAKGSAALARALGFQRYLHTAEREQLRFEEQEGIFARYLPYAVVLGETERWAKAFRDLDARAGSDLYWYHGPSGWNAAHFTDSMDHFTVATSGNIASTPSSSGSSGFSGGSSGGGGGGGGGGGW